jgi:hypothetical protein
MTEVRESGLEERVRRDAEKAENNRIRQERLGVVSKVETEEPPPTKSKAKPRADTTK